MCHPDRGRFYRHQKAPHYSQDASQHKLLSKIRTPVYTSDQLENKHCKLKILERMTLRTSSCVPAKMCAVDAPASAPSGAEVTAFSEASFLRV